MKDKKSFFANKGFTFNEAKAILFLSFFILFSLIIYFVFTNKNTEKAFDNKYLDSAFFNNKPKNQKVVSSKNKRTDNSKTDTKFCVTKVNLRTATIKQLVLIPNITEKKAIQIIQLRNKGKLNSLINIVEAGIVSRTAFEDIKQYIYIQ